MELKVKRLHPAAVLPRYATDGAACFDLVAIEGRTIGPDRAGSIPTGLAFEVPPGHALMIYSRSGHGFKHGTRLANCVGVIDSDYRGEVMVALRNDTARGDGYAFSVLPGDRIAQAMLVQAPQVQLVEVQELGDTARGAGGFGSTGS